LSLFLLEFRVCIFWGRNRHFCALDFIHIKARARVESAPSFSRRVVVVVVVVARVFLLPPPSPGRKRRAKDTVQRERDRERSLNKKVKSNLSGKEKKPSRETSLSLSLSRSSLYRETRAKKESRETFFIHLLSRCCCLPLSFSGRFLLLVLRDESATRVSDLFSRRELGPEEGGN
jgi:hypothetical protein